MQQEEEAANHQERQVMFVTPQRTRDDAESLFAYHNLIIKATTKQTTSRGPCYSIPSTDAHRLKQLLLLLGNLSLRAIPLTQFPLFCQRVRCS